MLSGYEHQILEEDKYCARKCLCNNNSVRKKREFYSLSNTCKLKSNYPAGIYLLEVNNRNTKTKYEICSELSIKIPERRYAEHNSDSTVPAKLSKSLEKLEIDDVIGSLQTAVLISTTAIFRRVLNL